MQIAVLMTCFNRIQTTLRCLEHLIACDTPEGYSVDVYLVDDASPDHTGEIVKKKYPNVSVIQGTGNLYWCGGMRKAWEAAASVRDYAFFVWLNDDTHLFQEALIELLSTHDQCIRQTRQEAVVCGATVDSLGSKCTYSGYDRTGRLIVPNGEPQEAWCINGNVVLIPKRIFGKLGNFSPYFVHALGDFDYGLRAKASNFGVFVSRHMVGSCDANSSPKWIDPNVRFIDRLRNLYSPKGNATPCVYFRYLMRHYGLIRTLINMITVHIRVLYPKGWNHGA